MKTPQPTKSLYEMTSHELAREIVAEMNRAEVAPTERERGWAASNLTVMRAILARAA